MEEKVKSKQKKYLYKDHNYMEKYMKRYYIEKPWMTAFKTLKQRCNYTGYSSYIRYGGRGIKNYLTKEDMEFIWNRDKAGEMNSPSIDRINTNGDYSLDNCRYIELLDNIGRFHREKTHCKQGHEFTKENTKYYKCKHLIKRKCRICEKVWDRRHKDKIKKIKIQKTKETA